MKNRDLHRFDIVIRIAWLYYTYGLTQEEISKHLNISRPMVQRLLAQASSEKLIKISIDHPMVECLELEKKLMEYYKLSYCRVCPAPGGEFRQVLPGLATLGASVMEEFIRRSEPTTIAIGTGRTIRACVRELKSQDMPQHRIVSLVGNLKHDGSASPFDSVMAMAEKINAKRFYLPGPVFTKSKEELRKLLKQPIYRNVLKISESADVAFIAIAGINPEAPILIDGFITEIEARELLKQGAVGEILGNIFDAEGKLINHELNKRNASAKLKNQTTYQTICISGGRTKHQSLSAALRGGWLSGLVTDEHTANALITG